MSSIETSTSPAIKYGTRAKFGMMLPSVNAIAEPQISAMLPLGVSLHTTRLRLVGGGNHLAMLDRLEEATQLLADAQVDRIMFHCTAVSMWSPEIVGEIRRRIATVTDTPVVVTSDAVLSALEAFDAEKIVLLTPYTQDINDRELRFLGHHGITVLRERGLGIASGIGMSSVSAERWYDEALAMRHPEADAYFLSCTAVRTADVIESLERALERPVFTSNQVASWRVLREAGIDDSIAGFGRLLREK
jgi:maleate isomerase